MFSQSKMMDESSTFHTSIKRRAFYTLILLIVGLIAPNGIIRQLLQWPNQSSFNIKRRLMNPNPETSLTTATPSNEIDVLVKLYGQFGNHLHLLGMAHILRSFAMKMNPPVDIHLHYTSLDVTQQRLLTARSDINACFTNFKSTDFYEIDEPSRLEIIANQRKYQGRDYFGEKARDSKGKKDDLIAKKIRFIADREYLSFGDSETAPYLRSTSFADPYLVDEHYDDLVELFRFNEERCCSEVPDPDETVVVSNIVKCTCKHLI